MDFELSDDQEALRDAAGELLDGYASPQQVRAVVDAGSSPDDRLWKAMVEQGWLGVVVPEDQGGLGLGWVEAAVLLEATGAHVAPAPFLSQLLAIDALAASGAAPPWLERLLEGGAIATVAWREVALTDGTVSG